MSNKYNIKSTEDLAMIFYYNFLDNGGEDLDPNSESHRIMGEINDTLEELIGKKQMLQIEGKILEMNNIDCIDHFVWGFEQALEMCRVVYNNNFTVEQIETILNK